MGIVREGWVEIREFKRRKQPVQIYKEVGEEHVEGTEVILSDRSGESV